MSKIESAVNFMVGIANDASHGYDQVYRWGEKGDYDCSSLQITAWERAGVPVKTNGATYTGNMYSVFKKCGFKDVTSQCNLSNGSGMKRGDVLLNHAYHTAMFIGNGQLVQASINEKGTATGGQPGDQKQQWGQTGEINIKSYYNYPWDCVLRYQEQEDPDGNTKSGGTVQTRKNETGDVSYQTHSRGYGWMESRCDGDMAGTTGQNRRIEAIKIWLKEGKINSVKVHLKGDGDKTYNNPTKDTVIGTTGQKKRIEAITINSDVPLRYRVHQKTYGWTGWVSNGKTAGKTGQSKQLEAIQVYKPMFLVRGHVQTSGWSGYVGDKETVGTTGKSKRLEALQFDPLNETIECSAHIQGTGWVHYGVITKDTVIGTVGQADRLECLRFKGNFEFRVHVQGSGWTDWTEADGIATLGTTGQALRIEAIEFRRK